MECLLVGAPAVTRLPCLLIESADERWRCTAVADPAAAYGLLCDVLLVFPGEGAAELARLLAQRPPLQAPYLAACGWDCPEADLRLDADMLPTLPARIAALERAACLPRLCLGRLDMLTELAEGLLRALELRPGLHAWTFLPDMAALASVHPALLTGLSRGLYPLVARRHGLQPAAVERSLRLAVESAWTRSDLAALERFFGQSISPDKGKPTNREFLCCVAEHLTLAARRCL